MSVKDDYDKRVLRWFRNRTVISWASGITISVTALSTLAYLVVHLYHWWYSTAHGTFAHIIIISTNLFYGVSSLLGFILSLWILGQINPERFTTAQELLGHCIELFDDANKSNSCVNLLILSPNPGQFDEVFNLPKRRHDFSELKQKIQACLDNRQVSINLVCLAGMPAESGSSLYRFLNKFFNSEVGLANKDLVTRLEGINGYLGAVHGFMQDYFMGKKDQSLFLSYIHEDWVDEMEKGEPIMVIGYANNEAFLGTISFKGENFNFTGLDFKGDVATVKTLYDSMVKKYTQPPQTP